MSQEQLMKIILAPCMSEKSTNIKIDRQYVFRVRRTATKPQIAKAIKLLFNVDAEAVRISNVKGKQCKFGGVLGQHQDWKKAYVTVKEGQVIDLGAA